MLQGGRSKMEEGTFDRRGRRSKIVDGEGSSIFARVLRRRGDHRIWELLRRCKRLFEYRQILRRRNVLRIRRGLRFSGSNELRTLVPSLFFGAGRSKNPSPSSFFGADDRTTRAHLRFSTLKIVGFLPLHSSTPKIEEPSTVNGFQNED